jgi:uncharacterized coiled-coil protein SlyX/tetrahydromethanopterin S-methyltransferase subunit G
MATTDERLGDLETRMNEQARGIGVLSTQISALGERLGGAMDRLTQETRGIGLRLDRFEGRFDGFEGRFDRFEGRMDRFEGRMDKLDKKLDDVHTDLSGRIGILDQKLDRRVDTLDAKVDRAMAFQVATLLALVGGMMTALLRSWRIL